MHNALPTLDVVALLLPSALDVPDLFRCCPARATTGNPCQEAPKSTPEAPKSTLGGSKIAQEGQGAAQERPRSAQERPRASQERLKSAPRAPQERPKSAHERCKSAQERPKSHSRAPRDAPERPWGTILRLRSSKEAAFEGDPSRDSVEKRVRNDFRSVFASCAQTRTC